MERTGRLISFVTPIKPRTELICRSARHKDSGGTGEYVLSIALLYEQRIKPIYCYLKTTPTRSRMPGLYRRAVSRASWARHSWIRPALNLVRGFVRSPFLRLIPDPVGPQSRREFATYRGAARDPQKIMIIITLELTALLIDGRWVLRPPRPIAIPWTVVTVTFDERAIGAYCTRDGAARYVI